MARIIDEQSSIASTSSYMGSSSREHHLIVNVVRVQHTQKCKKELTPLSEELTHNIIYSPFCSEDAVTQAMAQNVSRLLGKKNKPQMLVVCNDPAWFRTTIDYVKEIDDRFRVDKEKREEYDKILKKCSFNETWNKDHEFYYYAELKALESLKVIEIEEIKDKSIGTIRVVGHGKADYPFLMPYIGPNINSHKHISDVMKELAQLKPKLKQKAKIKFTSCESADKAPIDTFTHRQCTGDGIALAECARLSAGYYFGNENDVVIYGYHGMGLRRYKYKDTNVRGISVRKIDGTLKYKEITRASRVRKEF